MDLKNIKVPKHIGFILDGNGRWAESKGLPRLAGHRAGIKAIKKVVIAAREFGIKVISLFAFSTENWKRSKEEVDGIFNLAREYINEETDKYKKEKIKFRVMGDVTRLPQDLQTSIAKAIEETKNNDEFIINLALNYGARDEIVRAVNKLLESGKKNITNEDFEQQLYSSSLPDLDFIIRTSGEQRLSNFMLYQGAYAELYFPKTYWPDFNKKALADSLQEFNNRHRRFGGR